MDAARGTIDTPQPCKLAACPWAGGPKGGSARRWRSEAPGPRRHRARWLLHPCFRFHDRCVNPKRCSARCPCEESVAAAWEELKTLQLNPNTALTGKTKELIGLAVAAQIPCSYCVYFHTRAARMNGASDEEVKEAIAMAALTRHWSTVLNGSQLDETQFRHEVDQITSEARKATTMRDTRARPNAAPAQPRR